MGGDHYFWLGASADADPALVSDQAASRLAPTGFDPLREEKCTGDGGANCRCSWCRGFNDGYECGREEGKFAARRAIRDMLA